jgi:hypothetical protein
LSVRQQLLAGLASLIAMPALAETSETLRISGVIQPACSLAAGTFAIQSNGAGTWTGTAGYACNAGHLVVISLGEDLAGATVEIDGLGASVADEIGQAVIYRREAHFGPATVQIRSSETLYDIDARIVVQPL